MSPAFLLVYSTSPVQSLISPYDGWLDDQSRPCRGCGAATGNDIVNCRGASFPVERVIRASREIRLDSAYTMPEEIGVGREEKGQAGDRTRDSLILEGYVATTPASRCVEESSTPTIGDSREGLD